MVDTRESVCASIGMRDGSLERETYLELDLRVSERDFVEMEGGCTVDKGCSCRSDRLLELLWRQGLTFVLPARFRADHTQSGSIVQQMIE